MTVGVLSVQGAFAEHIQMLRTLGAKTKEIRETKDLADISAIVLPGGESTVQSRLLHKLDLYTPIRERILDGMPVLATCAGLILLADQIEEEDKTVFATLPVTVRRNAYGRQSASFAVTDEVAGIGAFPMVFIRAPYITEVRGNARVIAETGGHVVGVRAGSQIALSFHPELTKDTRIHEAFLRLV